MTHRDNSWQAHPFAGLLDPALVSGLAPEDALIVRTLAPGGYTAILSGTAGGTGVGIVEIFDVPSQTEELSVVSGSSSVLVARSELAGAQLELVDAPLHGSVSVGDGELTFAASSSYSGLDTFRFSATLGDAVINTDVSVTVMPRSAGVSAGNDLTVNEGDNVTMQALTSGDVDAVHWASSATQLPMQVI